MPAKVSWVEKGEYSFLYSVFLYYMDGVIKNRMESKGYPNNFMIDLLKWAQNEKSFLNEEVSSEPIRRWKKVYPKDRTDTMSYAPNRQPVALLPC